MNTSNEPIEDRESDDSKRVEYQVCQQSADANGSSFWTLASIFIGFSSVLLGGMVYGLISNNMLLDDFSRTSTLSASVNIFTFRIIATIVCIAMIIIYILLRYWLKRVQFLQFIDYQRMREIELDLWMCKSLRVMGIDNWERLSDKEKERLTSLKLYDWCKAQRKSPDYEPPSRRRHFPLVLYTLISLWGSVFLSIWFLPLFYHWVGID